MRSSHPPTGTVVIADVPFENRSGSKPRPVVLVGDATYWQGDDCVCVCPITSSAPRPQDVSLAWEAARLRQASCVRPRPVIIPKDCVTHRVGQLTPQDTSSLRRTVRRVLDLG